MGQNPTKWIDAYGLYVQVWAARGGWAIGSTINTATQVTFGLSLSAYIGFGLYDLLHPDPSDFIYNNEDATDINDDTDMSDPTTWPKPPVDGECEEGEPSRKKPRTRGEKSLYDPNGGEWRPGKPDNHHPEGHWDHKPAVPWNSPWVNIPVNGN